MKIITTKMATILGTKVRVTSWTWVSACMSAMTMPTAMAAATAGPEARITLGVGYDDPRITAAEKCRYDASVVVPADFVPDRRVNVMDLPGGPCAVATYTGSSDGIVDAWDRVFAGWLPVSAWQPDDRPCVEVYRGNAMVDPKAGVFTCELCLPVRPL